MADTLVRLQKFIAECGVCSRRAAEVLITAGKVRVNGKVITELGTKVDPEHDQVYVRNKIVRPAPKGIVLFHKPKHVVSTLDDPQGRPSIKDYLTKHYKSYFPVGRLDFESTGLVILTNDGELADRLLHPRYGLERVYEARVAGTVAPRTLAKLSRGILLEDGMARAEAEILNNAEDSTWLRIRVHEGRNRLIRRIMEKVHHPVSKLKRVSHGPFTLHRLKPGEMRKLTEREYSYFHRKVMTFNPSQERSRRTQDNQIAESE